MADVANNQANMFHRNLANMGGQVVVVRDCVVTMFRNFWRTSRMISVRTRTTMSPATSR